MRRGIRRRVQLVLHPQLLPHLEALHVMWVHLTRNVTHRHASVNECIPHHIKDPIKRNNVGDTH